MFEQFTARMYGIYPEDGFPDEVHALFPDKESADAYLANLNSNEDTAINGLQVLATDVAAAMWNSTDDAPQVALDGSWLRTMANAEDNSTVLGWPFLESYSDEVA